MNFIFISFNTLTHILFWPVQFFKWKRTQVLNTKPINDVIAISFQYLLPSFDRSIISCSKNFLSLVVKNSSRWIFTSSLELKVSSVNKFWRDQKRWKSESTSSGEYGVYSKTSQPRSQTSAMSAKKCMAWHCHEERHPGGFQNLIYPAGHSTHLN